MSHHSALLVIDVQLGLFDERWPVYAGDQLLTRLAALIDRARAADVPIIYIQHCDEAGSPLALDAPGWAIHPAVAPRAGELVLQKRHPDSFQDTGLQQELDARSIKALTIAGMQTEFCVDTTCRRAYSLGYQVTLVQDAHSTLDSGALSAQQIIDHHNHTLACGFARLTAASDVRFKLQTAAGVARN